MICALFFPRELYCIIAANLSISRLCILEFNLLEKYDEIDFLMTSINSSIWGNNCTNKTAPRIFSLVFMKLNLSIDMMNVF